MDPELYVFPRIQSPAVKILASTAVFVLVVAAGWLLLPRLTGPRLWFALDCFLPAALSVLLGYSLFIYASYHAWRATRLKNSVEDPAHLVATCILDTGYYARVRHPMYAMFILANAGLGLALNSVYGLGFSLLSWGLFTLNGIFEERASLIPQFGEQYRAYMRRVHARFFTLIHTIFLVVAIGMNVAGVIFR